MTGGEVKSRDVLRLFRLRRGPKIRDYYIGVVADKRHAKAIKACSTHAEPGDIVCVVTLAQHTSEVKGPKE